MIKLKDNRAIRNNRSTYTLQLQPQQIQGDYYGFKLNNPKFTIDNWDMTSVNDNSLLFTSTLIFKGYALLILTPTSGSPIEWIGEITTTGVKNQYAIVISKRYTSFYYLSNNVNAGSNNILGRWERKVFNPSAIYTLADLLSDDPFALSYINGFSDKQEQWKYLVSQVYRNDYKLKYCDTLMGTYSNGIEFTMKNKTNTRTLKYRYATSFTNYNQVTTYTTYAILKEKVVTGTIDNGNIYYVPLIDFVVTPTTQEIIVTNIKDEWGIPISIAYPRNSYSALYSLLSKSDFNARFDFQGFFNGPKIYETNFVDKAILIETQPLGGPTGYFIAIRTNIYNTDEAFLWEFDCLGISNQINYYRDRKLYISLMYKSLTFYNISIDYKSLKEKDTLNPLQGNPQRILGLSQGNTITFTNKITCQMVGANSILDFGEPIPFNTPEALGEALANANVEYNNGINLQQNQAIHNASKLSHEKYISNLKNPLGLLGQVLSAGKSEEGRSVGNVLESGAELMTASKFAGQNKAMQMDAENNKKMLEINRDNQIAMAKANTTPSLMSTSDISLLNFYNQMVIVTNTTTQDSLKERLQQDNIRCAYLGFYQEIVLQEFFETYGVMDANNNNRTIDIINFRGYLKVKFFFDNELLDVVSNALSTLPNMSANELMLEMKSVIGNGIFVDWKLN